MSESSKALKSCLILAVLLFIGGVIFILFLAFVGSLIGSTEQSSTDRLGAASATNPPSTPVPTPTPSPTPVAASLPLEIKSSSGWTLTVESIGEFSTIDADTRRYRSENGTFAVFIGTLGNYSDEDGCLKGDEFFIIDSNGDEYEMDSTLLDVLKPKYERDYPGFFRGQCLDYDATVRTFLVFDVPNTPPYPYN